MREPDYKMGRAGGWEYSGNTLSFTMFEFTMSFPLARYPRGGAVQMCVKQQNGVCESEAGAEGACLDWGQMSESHPHVNAT